MSTNAEYWEDIAESERALGARMRDARDLARAARDDDRAEHLERLREIEGTLQTALGALASPELVDARVIAKLRELLSLQAQAVQKWLRAGGAS